MLELRTRTAAGNSQARFAFENPQPRRLLLALVLLLVALGIVVLTNQQFWFGSDESTLDSDGPIVPSRPATTSVPVPSKPARSAATKKHVAVAAPAATESKTADAPVVATNRTVLPPLDVEVIAGDTHSRVHPGSNASKVEVTRPEVAHTEAKATEPTALAATTNAAERTHLSIEAVRPPAAYPVLAQHMNVQGSVVLQAIIGADGIIENMHVLSGPAILASAAQQAVREWRFKPILQNGQPVESKAKITVNFTIKIADSSANNTLAESRADGVQTVSR